MPFAIRKKENKFDVYRKDTGASMYSSGATMPHDRSQAEAYMRALYAHSDDAANEAGDTDTSVKAVVTNAAGHVLVLKDARSDYNDLPGGHLKQGERMRDGLAREVHEETGLKLTSPVRKSEGHLLLGGKKTRTIFYAAKADGDPKLSSEHSGYEWVPKHKLATKNLGVLLPHAELAANDSRFMEGNFSVPLNGRHSVNGTRLNEAGINTATERGREMIESANEGKYLVSKKGADGKMEHHLPVHDARHLGMAWAALHGGFRGQEYQGPDKEQAIKKLTALYKKRGLTPPSE